MPVFTKLVPLLLCFAALQAQAHEVPQDIGDMTLSQVSENIYVMHGVQAMPSKQNKGFISNSGIVISDEGVVIVDSGGSRAHGEMLLQKLAELTDKPVIAVFNTHLHGDHWLGNAAIREAYPGVRFYAHERTVTRLKNGEADTWLDMFGSALGKDIAGTEAVLPDNTLGHGDTLTVAGNRYRAHHTGKAHTDGDIMIELPGSKLLFAGDIVMVGSVPSGARPQDFSAKGQIRAVEHALGLPVEVYVPGHGATGGREVPQATERFLKTLYGSVQDYYDEGLADFEMRDKVIADLAEFSDWNGMDQIGRVISFVYQQVEAAAFE